MISYLSTESNYNAYSLDKYTDLKSILHFDRHF